ncbi:nucleotidyltransferase family protein [Paracoccus contaminans]|uniref:Nucleotidyltransferase n=1 Tax=Paracoccus contaminans TaxID=1945662 RepID=A0A1W6CVU9_9RHOB|nr:nucleotidyltransferase family protein [Paracoccus contaminans]ARJ68955.1 hypothetical protein B0A89_04240 [Paracoccus contaminans]
MAFTGETIAAMTQDASPEMAVLLAASRPSADRAPAPHPIPRQAGGAPRPVDPDLLFELARLNKMLGVLPLSPAALPPGCAGLAPRLLQVHLQTMSMNRRVMAVTAEVVQALAGIRVVVLKGPFQQQALHGNAARRPSGDIDLFVAPADRARAAARLRDHGFAPTEEDRALWWIRFLGEQHFQRAADGAVVDLHHRLQQVGLPAWRRSGEVLARAVSLAHDGQAVPVPSAIDGCLLLGVTLAKALLAHEPCGWAAAELAHAIAQLPPADWPRLWQAAKGAGQDRTLALGLALAAACCGPLRRADGSPAEPGAPVLRGMPRDAALLRDLVFQPWRRPQEALRRRQMLLMLAQGRPHVAAVESARALASPLVLNRLMRQGGAAGQPAGDAGDQSGAGA